MRCTSTDELPQEMHGVPAQQYKVQVLTGTYHLLVALDVNINRFELRNNPTLGQTLMVGMISWVIDAEPFPLIVRTQYDAVITLCRSKGIAQRPSFDPETRAMRPIGRLKA